MERMTRKILALMICLMLLLTALPSWAEQENQAESFAWQITSTQQNGDTMSVWYVTNQKVTNLLSYKLGNVDLQEISQPNNSFGVGYIFVVDGTKYYSSVSTNVEDVIAYAAGNMAANDRVAFVRVAGDITSSGFVYAADALSLYQQNFSGSRQNTNARMLDGISEAVAMAVQDTESMQHVVIAITDGDEKGSTMTMENLAQRFQGVYLPLNVLILGRSGRNDDSNDLITMGNTITANGSSYINEENFKTAIDNATRISRHVYMSELRLPVAVREVEAKDQILTIGYQGGNVLAKSRQLNLAMAGIPTYTPVPTETPVLTPEPTKDPVYIGYDTENKGEIQQLHNLLSSLSYYTGSITSTYTDETEAAVQLFYDINGLTDKPARGGITQEAFALLKSGKALANPTPEPTVAPTIDPTYIGYNTEKRTLIQQLNNRLLDTYYLTDETLRDSSTYTDATEAAVQRFYKQNGLTDKPDNGGLTEAAFKLLLSDKVIPAPTVAPTVAPTEDPYPCYIGYDTGSKGQIIELHRMLAELYYYQGEGGSAYTDDTEDAVVRFCEDNNLRRPSIQQGMTEEAFIFLKSGNAMPQATATPDPTVKFYLTDLTSEEAMSAREQLVALGYLGESANFDANNMALAIRALCLRNGIENREGVMTVEAWNLLASGKAVPAVDPPVTIQLGDGVDHDVSESAKEQILNFQMALKELGYYDNIDGSFIPGAYDDKTQQAWERFLSVNGMVDNESGVDWEEQQIVLTSKVSNTEPDFLEKVRKVLTGSTEIAGRAIPIWILVAFGALIVIIIIVVIVVAVKAGKKKEDSGETAITAAGGGVSVGGDAPTEDLNNGGGLNVIGADAPTTVNTGSWHLTMMITDSRGINSFKSFDVEEGQVLVIGRGSQADILMDPEDTSISRSHGTFVYESGQLYYTDTSRAGTMVDNQMIHNSKVPLYANNELRLGHCGVKINQN